MRLCSEYQDSPSSLLSSLLSYVQQQSYIVLGCAFGLQISGR